MSDHITLKDYLNEAVPPKPLPGLPTFSAPPPNAADDADRDEDAAILQLTRAQDAAAASTSDSVVENRLLIKKLIERVEALSDNQIALTSVLISLMEKLNHRE